MKIIAGNEILSIADNKQILMRSTFYKTIRILYIVLRYSFLLLLLILLAGHEAANSKIGKSTIEFYSFPFRDAISDSQNYSEGDFFLIRDFYSKRNFTPAWTVNFEVNKSYIELMGLLKNSYNYGLLPSFYNYADIRKEQMLMEGNAHEGSDLTYRIGLEVRTTRAALLFARHLAYGINSEDTSSTYITFSKRLPDYLNRLLENNKLEYGILDLQPGNNYYKSLQSALAKYMRVASADTLPMTSMELMEKEDMIIRRLMRQGFLDTNFTGDSASLASAIVNFQRTHYLETSGKPDHETLKMLAIGTREKFYRIAINLDRIRKDNLRDTNCVLINIPEYRLHYYDDKGLCSNFNVIVGKKETPTPILSSVIEMIVANPHWTVPQSISRNEIIPLLKKDSLYLKKHGFIVVDNKNNPVNVDSVNWKTVVPGKFNHWFRQVKVDNALGNVKFLFPNDESVYLHDTPSRDLFKAKNRSYSHGCIRLENPISFASLILDNSNHEISADQIEEILKNRKQQEIKLKKTVPIYIRYLSCIADKNGNICYYPDIYGLDENAIQQLFGNTSWN